MKNTKFALPIVVLVALFMSCSTTPVPYSFVEDGSENAAISFIRGSPGLTLIYFNGEELPNPEKNTHWEPILVPAGIPLKLTVHAYYEQGNYSQGLLVALITSAITASRSVNLDVLFECPALEAGKEYKLTFRKGAGLPGENLLVLTDISTKKIVYQQEFTSR